MLQLVKDQNLDYKTFIGAIAHRVKESMGEGYNIQIYKVMKNNSLELDSLIVLQEGKNVSPNIYLMPYYESYLEGTPMNEIIERLCSIYRDSTVPIVDNNFQYSYEEMKPYIIYRLISYDRNKKLLENVPYIKYFDLAITFHCLVRNDEDGIGTIRITNEHLKIWDASLNEIEAFAKNNTKKYFPISIRTMDEVIKEMLFDDMDKDLPEEIINQILYQSFSYQHEYKMYILSNLKGINGATCMLYEDVFQELASQIKSNFYILPSSIHEIILVPDDNNMKKETLMEMVKDVNCTQVAPEEVLSNEVYYYSRERNSIIK